MSEPMSPELEERIRELLAAPDADTAFVAGLRSKLVAGNRLKTYRRVSPRLAWGIVSLLILLILGSLAFSPRVVEAMRRLLGYIPGVGYVERGSSLRLLSAPVTVQKEGLTLIIKEGAADSQRTVLLAQVDGYARTGMQTCMDQPRLVAADGTVADVAQVSGTPDENNSAVVFVRYEFKAIPAGQLDATLEIPCLLWDENYRDWSVPLHFQVAAGTDQVAPVIELPTSLPTQPIPTDALPPDAESAPAGFSIVLKSVAELKDGYVLSGNYQWSDTRIDKSMVAISDSNMIDAQGQDVPFQPVDTDASADSGPQQIPFAFQITGKTFAWPLKIVVNAISVIQPDQGTFQFDPGPDPRAGQTWNVNIDVPVGRHVIHVQTIELTAGRMPTELGYDFTMTSDPAVAGAVVNDQDPIIVCNGGCGGGGGGGGNDAGPSGFNGALGPFSYGTSAQGYDPAGVKTFVISEMSIFFRGPWQVTWQPSSP